MIYTRKNCKLGTKLYDDQGREIRRVVSVDTEAASLVHHLDPLRLNSGRTDVAQGVLKFDRIEISKRCPQTNLPMEFRCYGRLSD